MGDKRAPQWVRHPPDSTVPRPENVKGEQVMSHDRWRTEKTRASERTHASLQKHVSPKSYVHLRLWTLRRRLARRRPLMPIASATSQRVCFELSGWRGTLENTVAITMSFISEERNYKRVFLQQDIIGKETGKGSKVSWHDKYIRVYSMRPHPQVT